MLWRDKSVSQCCILPFKDAENEIGLDLRRKIPLKLTHCGHECRRNHVCIDNKCHMGIAVS